MITKRLLVDHIDNCSAVEQVIVGRWGSPWCLPKYIRGDKRGNFDRASTTAWIEFRCNCRECPARLVIREDAVLEAFGEGVIIK